MATNVASVVPFLPLVCYQQIKIPLVDLVGLRVLATDGDGLRIWFTGLKNRQVGNTFPDIVKGSNKLSILLAHTFLKLESFQAEHTPFWSLEGIYHIAIQFFVCFRLSSSDDW